MTSEAKEAFLNSWFGSLPECSGHWTNGMSGNLADEVSNRFDEAIQAYTRSVPDVPELERYSADGIMWGIDGPDGAQPTPNGEYVRYDQAAAIITKEREKVQILEQQLESDDDAYSSGFDAGFGEANMARNKRAEAAEAQLKAVNAKVAQRDEALRNVMVQRDVAEAELAKSRDKNQT